MEERISCKKCRDLPKVSYLDELFSRDFVKNEKSVLPCDGNRFQMLANGCK